MHQYLAQAWPHGAIGAYQHHPVLKKSLGHHLCKTDYVHLIPSVGIQPLSTPSPLVKVSFIITSHLSTPIMEMKHNPHHHFKTAFGSFFADIMKVQWWMCQPQNTISAKHNQLMSVAAIYYFIILTSGNFLQVVDIGDEQKLPQVF